MKYCLSLNRLAIFFAALIATCSFAQDDERGGGSGKLEQTQDDLENKDWEALRQYLKSRREEEKDQSKSALLLSGDARVDWRNKHEVFGKNFLFGDNAADVFGVRRGPNRFDVQVNLRLDYDLEKSWAVIQWQYDNKAGIDDDLKCIDVNAEGKLTSYCREMFGSGNCGELCLKQAFFGYNLYKCGDTEFDIEIGRRYLYYIFDSNVQFLSRFDGILLSLGGIQKKVVDWYVHLGGFVVDYRVNDFAWIAELGALNITDSGLDLKYSFIDWRKNGVNRCSRGVNTSKVVAPRSKTRFSCGDHNPPGYKFLVSQWTASYTFNGKFLCNLFDKKMRIFGAALCNHMNPDPHAFKKRQTVAWYAGYRIGDVKKADDWAWQMMYQYVEALSVPDQDMSGIGNGNVVDNLTLTDGTGETNFKGWRFDGMYAFTDEITINARVEWSTQIAKPKCFKKEEDSSHFFRQIKVELVYAF